MLPRPLKRKKEKKENGILNFTDPEKLEARQQKLLVKNYKTQQLASGLTGEEEGKTEAARAKRERRAER